MFIKVGSFYINMKNVVSFKEIQDSKYPQTPYGIKFTLITDGEILLRYNTEEVRNEEMERILTQIDF